MLASLDLVVFQHQNYTFALEANYVQGQGRLGGEEPLNQLLSFASLLGEPSAKAALHWLAINTQEREVWLLGLEEPAELISVSSQQIHALPSFIAAKCQLKALRAQVWPLANSQCNLQQSLIHILDARLLYNP